MADDPDKTKEELAKALKSGAGPKVARFALACLSAIPGVGGAIGGAAGLWSEAEQDFFKRVLASWLKLQEAEVKEIGQTMAEVMMRLDHADETIRERIQSPEYLSLVNKCFRDWSAAESEEKRVLVRNLLSNAAAGKQLCGDDIIRMFVAWIDRYTEVQFAIIRLVYKQPGITRQEMWQEIYAREVREDSAEADLFKLLVQELSIGHVIRQHREKDYQGNFLKAPPQKNRAARNPYRTSAFDDEKEYEITELGRWFVHYTMNEIVPKLTQGETSSTEATASQDQTHTAI